MKRLFFLLIALSFGCDVYRSSEIISLRRTSAGIWMEGVPLSPVLNPYTFNPANEKLPLYLQAQQNNDLGKSARNRLQSAMMTLSDQIVSQQLEKIAGLQVEMNTVLGTSALGLSSGATMASLPLATYLSGSAAALSAAQSSFNEQIYRDAVMQSLVGAIESDRATLAADIRQRQSESIDDYSVEAAIEDAIDYHQRGSFYHGLTLIRQAIETSNQERVQQATIEAARQRENRVLKLRADQQVAK
ncbi:MAG TPA: hypothetical protein VKK61_07620 [Tepidisphaeraceae bacterium]|nr:hypothetical protein [Tepidisphaeraceae bacterium]